MGYPKEPWQNRSITQQNRFSQEANRRAACFLADHMGPDLSQQLSEQAGTRVQVRTTDQDVIITYPRAFSLDYILPEIRLEIGPLAAWVPNEEKQITPYAAERFPVVFSQASTGVRTILAERISRLESSIDDGDRVLIYRLGRTPSRGDLTLFACPEDETKTFAKRVAGLPGERLRIDHDGRVHINGSPLSEPYVKPEYNRNPAAISEQAIPPGTYFVIGDNRDQSNDSRFFGPVPVRLIRGTVTTRYWPPGRPLK